MRFLKWAGIGLSAMAALGLLAIGYVYIASERIIARAYALPASHFHASRGADAVARGQRLAAAYGCADCHRANLQGGYVPFARLSSRNLTRLAKAFSDADFDPVVRHGSRPDGTSVAEAMPSDAFQFVSDSDLADIVAYIRSHKPAGADIPVPSYDLLSRIGFVAGQAHTDAFWFRMQKPALDLGPHYARGRRIAMRAENAT